jgi:hypothetical protein
MYHNAELLMAQIRIRQSKVSQQSGLCSLFQQDLSSLHTFYSAKMAPVDVQTDDDWNDIFIARDVDGNEDPNSKAPVPAITTESSPNKIASMTSSCHS